MLNEMMRAQFALSFLDFAETIFFVVVKEDRKASGKLFREGHSLALACQAATLFRPRASVVRYRDCFIETQSSAAWLDSEAEYP